MPARLLSLLFASAFVVAAHLVAAHGQAHEAPGPAGESSEKPAEAPVVEIDFPVQPGQIVKDPVSCEKNPRFSYYIYLPSYFTTERSWPFLISHEPGGGHHHKLSPFRKAAEDAGVVILISREARRQDENVVPATLAMVNDVFARLPVDPGRAYLWAGHHGTSATAAIDRVAKQSDLRLRGLLVGPVHKIHMALDQHTTVFMLCGARFVGRTGAFRLYESLPSDRKHLRVFRQAAWGEKQSELLSEGLTWLRAQEMALSSSRDTTAEEALEYATRILGRIKALHEKDPYQAWEYASMLAGFRHLQVASRGKRIESQLRRNRAVREAIRARKEMLDFLEQACRRAEADYLHGDDSGKLGRAAATLAEKHWETPFGKIIQDLGYPVVE